MSSEVTRNNGATLGYRAEAGTQDVPPGYQRTEAGVIPEDWSPERLGNLFTFRNGLNKAKRFFGVGTPIVNYMDVLTHPGLRSAHVEGRVSVTAQEINSFEVRRGDVFFTRTSETLDEIGMASVMLEDLPNTVFSGFLLRARPIDTRLDNGYKQFSFSTHAVRQQVVSLGTYTTRALTNGHSLSAVYIPLPSLIEQRAIAEALSDVDKLLGSLEALINKKQDIKQATMQQLLTGQTRLPGCRDEWRTTRLGDYVTFLRNGVNSRAELLMEGRVKYIHYGDIHACKNVYLSTTSLPCLPDAKAASLDHLQDGDLIFADASEDVAGVSKSVELREVGSIKVVSGLHTIAARFNKEVLANGFKGFLQYCPPFATYLRRHAAGTKVYATNRAHIASIEMPLPPLREQSLIATVLSDMDAEIAVLQARHDKTRDLKQAMMQELLTGKTRLVQREVTHV